MNIEASMAGAMRRLRELARVERAAETEASSELFQAIRWRLAIWYSAVLAVILILCGVILYVGVRQSLLGPIDQNLQQSAQALSQGWQEQPALPFQSEPSCPIPPGSLDVCFDPDGQVLAASRFVAEGARSIADPSLVSAALHNGQAEDTIQTGQFLGAVRRYALEVPGPPGHTPLGVVLVAAQVGPQLQALDTLLHLLLLLGVLTILLSAIGGLLLANRALLPARLAYARQRNFIADASHELRTPLTMLRSNVEVVLRGRDRLPPDDVELLEDTVTEAGHLTSLANSMLDLARLDQEGTHLEEEVVDLAELAAQIVRWATALASEHGVRLSQAEHAGPVLVVGDRTLLEQAIMTLIDNAIKYNRPGGEVVVSTWTDGGQARVEIRDTGIGIEAHHLSRLGERFYRVDKARSRESGGAGLGLSIVRSIAARHNGSFHLSSEPGAGTVATLTLPSAEKRTAS